MKKRDNNKNLIIAGGIIIIVLLGFLVTQQKAIEKSPTLELENAPNYPKENTNFLIQESMMAAYAGVTPPNFEEFAGSGFDQPDPNSEPLPGYTHGTIGPQSSLWFPPNWIHGTDSPEGELTYYYPPGTIHETEGVNPSSYIKPPGSHNPDGQYETQQIEPWWIHIDEGKSATQYYPPEFQKHISNEESPQKTTLVPNYYKHIPEEGPMKTMYVPPQWEHITEEGEMQSMYIDKEFFKHVTEEGPMESLYVPINWRHITLSNGETTYYIPPNAFHIVDPNIEEYSLWAYKMPIHDTTTTEINPYWHPKEFPIPRLPEFIGPPLVPVDEGRDPNPSLPVI
jgi:hypothetical protein